jgi:uncharacterized protein (DUF1330 family)
MIFKVSLMYDITDYAAYGRYCEKAEVVIKQHGGRLIAVSYNNFDIICVEGVAPEAVNILVFPSVEQHTVFYNSPEYQELLKERQSICKAQLILMERYK